jgi:hypothetical protein
MEPYRKIYVRCGKCREEFDERKVKFLNIEEDIQGRDLMTFECPKCKTDQTSYRR